MSGSSKVASEEGGTKYYDLKPCMDTGKANYEKAVRSAGKNTRQHSEIYLNALKQLADEATNMRVKATDIKDKFEDLYNPMKSGFMGWGRGSRQLKDFSETKVGQKEKQNEAGEKITRAARGHLKEKAAKAATAAAKAAKAKKEELEAEYEHARKLRAEDASKLVGMNIDVEGMGKGRVLRTKNTWIFGKGGETEHVVQFEEPRRERSVYLQKKPGGKGRQFRILDEHAMEPKARRRRELRKKEEEKGEELQQKYDPDSTTPAKPRNLQTGLLIEGGQKRRTRKRRRGQKHRTHKRVHHKKRVTKRRHATKQRKRRRTRRV